MNLRQFTIALLISALPLTALAEQEITLNEGDFIAAERLSPEGETVVRVKLSKSGKAKFKKLNEASLGKEMQAKIAGVASSFKLREPIKGDGLEMGPYESRDADKVVSAINSK